MTMMSNNDCIKNSDKGLDIIFVYEYIILQRLSTQIKRVLTNPEKFNFERRLIS